MTGETPQVHDPALCEAEACVRCDIYGEGYASGKTAAYAEICAVLDGPAHSAECGCRPCRVLRAVLIWAEAKAEAAGLGPKKDRARRLANLPGGGASFRLLVPPFPKGTD